MTDYTQFYKALKKRPESEWVGILAVALKNYAPNVVIAIEDAIEELDDDLAMEIGSREMANAHPPRLGVPKIIINEGIEMRDPRTVWINREGAKFVVDYAPEAHREYRDISFRIRSDIPPIPVFDTEPEAREWIKKNLRDDVWINGAVL